MKISPLNSGRALILAVSLSALLLSGCSTLGGVGDKISDLNPFSRGDKPDEKDGVIPGESERLTILSLSETLQVDGKVSSADIVIPAPFINTDWPQPGGNPAHVMQNTASSGALTPLWTKGVGKGSSRKGVILASPIVANGTVYTIDANNEVFATDAETGERYWNTRITVTSRGKTRTSDGKLLDRVKAPFTLFGDKGGSDTEAIGGGIAYDGGRIYVASGYGLMIALDARTGEEIFRVPTGTPLHSAPTVSGGRVFAITDDNEIYAFDANSGEVLWTYQGIIETARMLSAPSPAVIDEVVLAPFSSGELVALRVQNGGVIWQDALSSSGKLTPLSSLNDIAAGPVVSDGYVIATAQSGVMSAFDLRSGQRIWSQPAGSLGFPWMAGDFIYTVTTDGQAAALSRTDGSVVWLTQLQVYGNERKKKDRIAWAGPIMAGGRLFFPSSHGQAVEINPLTGEIARSFKIGDPVFAQPIIANETIYLLGEDAKLVALR